jgi:pseudaminic acid synthase
MIDAVRLLERSLGGRVFGPQPGERKTLRYRRSLFVVRQLREGEVITDEHVRSIRPGDGLHPRHLPDVIGKRAACVVAPGRPLAWKRIIP